MSNISSVKIWRHHKKHAPFLGRKGKIISWTLVKVPPVGYEEGVSYPVVLVEFQDGKRMVGQLVDWTKKDLKTGNKVRVVYRRLGKADLEGVIQYGIKFRLY